MKNKMFKCTPKKDIDGRIDIDVTEIYNVDNEEERYLTAYNQWRIGELIREEDIAFNDRSEEHTSELQSH